MTRRRRLRGILALLLGLLLLAACSDAGALARYRAALEADDPAAATAAYRELDDEEAQAEAARIFGAWLLEQERAVVRGEQALLGLRRRFERFRHGADAQSEQLIRRAETSLDSLDEQMAAAAQARQRLQHQDWRTALEGFAQAEPYSFLHPESLALYLDTTQRFEEEILARARELERGNRSAEARDLLSEALTVLPTSTRFMAARDGLERDLLETRREQLARQMRELAAQGERAEALARYDEAPEEDRASEALAGLAEQLRAEELEARLAAIAALEEAGDQAALRAAIAEARALFSTDVELEVLELRLAALESLGSQSGTD